MCALFSPPSSARLPRPQFSPESVVASQLSALQRYDFDQVFALLSPAAQAMVGPLDKFIQGISKNR